MAEKLIKIDIDYLTLNSIFVYPLLASGGEQILEARTPLSFEKIEEIRNTYGRFVYYKDTGSHSAIPLYKMEIAHNKSMHIIDEIKQTQKISPEAIKEAEAVMDEVIQDLYAAEIEAITLLTDLKATEDYLFNHSVNVGVLAAVFAKQIGLFNQEYVKHLALGGYLLDIGTVQIDKQLLSKKGKLDIPEMIQVKRHPQLGYELLKRIPHIDPIVLQTVLFHHERFDNNGYFQMPYEQLPMAPKIVAICDIYDALTSDRPFRKAISPSRALAHLVNGINSFFDYKLVSDFINLLGPILNNTQSFYTRNDFIELSTQEIAMVREFGIKDYLKPEITVFCKFHREDKRVKVSYYDTPIEVNLEKDTSRLMTKIINNRQHIEAIRSNLEKRAMI